MRINQFNHCLRHTYFWKSSIFRELTIQPSQPQLRHTYNSKNEFCEKLFSRGVAIQPFNHCCDTHIIRKMSFARNYFCEDWQFNHSTTRCHRYVKDRTSRENSQYKLSIQPFQQLLQHTHFENWSLRETKFCELTYIFLKINYLERVDYSTKSTTVETHI